MKKFLSIILVLAMVLLSSACSKANNENAIAFKNEYESLNGKTNSNGKEHRTITIDNDNPYIKISQKELVEKIENKETFYLYIGDSLCPWCRSVIEKSIEVAKESKVKEIYYVDIWDDEGNEILRDKYELKDGIPSKVQDGTEYYEKLLKYFDSVLSDYTLTDENGEKVSVGEKRIYAPNFFYIKNGKAEKMVEGISDKQKDSREELTEEILKDEESIFKKFFNN